MSLIRRLSHAAAAVTIALGALTALALPAAAAPPAPARLSPLTSSVSSQTVAGYAVVASRVTRVSANFNLPNVSPCTACGPANPFLGAGIDGFNNSVSEQAGFEYYFGIGWRPFVMCVPLPCDWPIPPLPGPDPQDVVSVSLNLVSGDNFTATFTDLTQGWSGTTSFQDPSAQLKSGEVIVEDATSGGNPLQLPAFSTVGFSSAAVDNAVLSPGNATPIVMVSTAGQIMAQPSAVSSGAFSATWRSGGP